MISALLIDHDTEDNTWRVVIGFGNTGTAVGFDNSEEMAAYIKQEVNKRLTNSAGEIQYSPLRPIYI